jgi:Na+/proline symporter
MPDRDLGNVLLTGAAITGAGAVVGLLAGALSDGSGGLWAFLGMGAGALIAIAVLSVRVMRTL